MQRSSRVSFPPWDLSPGTSWYAETTNASPLLGQLQRLAVGTSRRTLDHGLGVDHGGSRASGRDFPPHLLGGGRASEDGRVLDVALVALYVALLVRSAPHRALQSTVLDEHLNHQAVGALELVAGLLAAPFEEGGVVSVGVLVGREAAGNAHCGHS